MLTCTVYSPDLLSGCHSGTWFTICLGIPFSSHLHWILYFLYSMNFFSFFHPFNMAEHKLRMITVGYNILKILYIWKAHFSVLTSDSQFVKPVLEWMSFSLNNVKALLYLLPASDVAVKEPHAILISLLCIWPVSSLWKLSDLCFWHSGI